MGKSDLISCTLRIPSIFSLLANMTATDVVSTSTQAQSGKSCPSSKESSPVKVKTPDCVQEEASTHLATGKRHLFFFRLPLRCCQLGPGVRVAFHTVWRNGQGVC